MNMQTVNLSANDIKEHLFLQLNKGWEVIADSEIDTVCINGREYNLGYIIALNMNTFSGNNFDVYEFVERKEDGATNESEKNFLTYDEALNFIRTKVDAYVNGVCKADMQ